MIPELKSSHEEEVLRICMDALNKPGEPLPNNDRVILDFFISDLEQLKVIYQENMESTRTMEAQAMYRRKAMGVIGQIQSLQRLIDM